MKLIFQDISGCADQTLAVLHSIRWVLQVIVYLYNFDDEVVSKKILPTSLNMAEEFKPIAYTRLEERKNVNPSSPPCLEEMESRVKLLGGSLSISSESDNQRLFAHTSNLAKIPLILVDFKMTKEGKLVETKFQVHSGAPLTLINWLTYEKISSPKLTQTDKKIVPYSAKNPIILLGSFKHWFLSRYKDKWVKADVYVSAEENNSPCIFSRSLSEQLGYLKVDPFITCVDGRPVAKVLGLGNKTVEFVVDSGSSATLINRSTYQKFGRPFLTSTDETIFPYSAKKPLALLGKFEVTLRRDLNSVRTVAYVVDKKKSRCVLSEKDAEELGLLKLCPNFTFDFSNVIL